MDRRVRGFLAAAVAGLAVYLGSYTLFRRSHVEVWEKNGCPYVIFPKDRIALYYVFRPLSWLDARLTGMGFHIGPHR